MTQKLKSAFTLLHNDKELLIRTVQPSDKDRLEAGLEMMSDEALYRRFFMPIKQLSDQQLEFFTSADQLDHIAWGILDAEHMSIPGLGIARCVRDKEHAHIAEAAVTIPDDYQGQGYGTLLLAILHISAAQNHMHVLRSIVLSENDGFIRLLKTLGGVIASEADNTVTIDQPVYSKVNDIPNNVKNKRFKKYMAELTQIMFK